MTHGVIELNAELRDTVRSGQLSTTRGKPALTTTRIAVNNQGRAPDVRWLLKQQLFMKQVTASR